MISILSLCFISPTHFSLILGFRSFFSFCFDVYLIRTITYSFIKLPYFNPKINADSLESKLVLHLHPYTRKRRHTIVLFIFESFLLYEIYRLGVLWSLYLFYKIYNWFHRFLFPDSFAEHAHSMLIGNILKFTIH